MTIANPKTPEAAQKLLADMLEQDGALEIPEDPIVIASPNEATVEDHPKKPEATEEIPEAVVTAVLGTMEAPAALAAPAVTTTPLPVDDSLEIPDDDVAVTLVKPSKPPPPAPPDILVAQTAQMTGISPGPVSKSMPEVLDVAKAGGTPTSGPVVSATVPKVLEVMADELEIPDDGPPVGPIATAVHGSPAAEPVLPPAAVAAVAPAVFDGPEIEVRESEPPLSSVDVAMSAHGGPPPTPKEERAPTFEEMKAAAFTNEHMRRKQDDDSYVVNTDLLWKFLRHLDVFLSTDKEDGKRNLSLRAKKMAVAELFARGEALAFLKGHQLDGKRMIQLKDIQEIVGALLTLADQETDEDRKRHLRSSFEPAVHWVRHQVNMDEKLLEQKGHTTAGKTPTPASKAVPVVAASAPPTKPAPPPAPSVVVARDTPEPSHITPPPKSVAIPPVAQPEPVKAEPTEKMPAVEIAKPEKTQPPKNPPPERTKETSPTVWIVSTVAIAAAAALMVYGFLELASPPKSPSNARPTATMKRPATVKAAATKRLVAPVGTDECTTVKIAGVYAVPLTDEQRHGLSAWDCSTQGHFTQLTDDTGKVCGCTFKN